ncbi:MAG TPA: type II toxin-antitoxin system VapC family toxin [Chloroflexi bacterium]|mgnify:CR=1 FL=1|nr:type II toxin-antitoxin system VapC family toxin [Chloroflexota bacterium]
MKPVLIDTDILSLFFRGHPQVETCFAAYTAVYPQINLSIVTYYEILSGLKHRDAHRQLGLFLEFVAQNTLLPLTERSVAYSADMYATTRAAGTPVDDIDLLIAGIAVANGLGLATHNRKHFEKITGLEVEDWATS